MKTQTTVAESTKKSQPTQPIAAKSTRKSFPTQPLAAQSGMTTTQHLPAQSNVSASFQIKIVLE
jgi:hypothetical protein